MSRQRRRGPGIARRASAVAVIALTALSAGALFTGVAVGPGRRPVHRHRDQRDEVTRDGRQPAQRPVQRRIVSAAWVTSEPGPPRRSWAPSSESRSGCRRWDGPGSMPGSGEVIA